MSNQNPTSKGIRAILGTAPTSLDYPRKLEALRNYTTQMQERYTALLIEAACEIDRLENEVDPEIARIRTRLNIHESENAKLTRDRRLALQGIETARQALED